MVQKYLDRMRNAEQKDSNGRTVMRTWILSRHSLANHVERVLRTLFFFSKDFGHTDTRSNETFIGHELMFPIGISRLGHLQSSQQFESE